MGGLVEQEGLEDGVRVPLVEVVAGHLDEAALFKKPFIDGPQGGRGLPARLPQLLLDVLQQDLVELGHRLGRPVVLAHEFFAGAQGQAALGGGLRLMAKALGHRGLQVKHQPVFAAARHQVQARADQAQQRFVALDLPRFVRGRNAFAHQGVPALAQAGRPGHPHDDLQIAQAPGRLLAVGLERIGRVFEFGVPLAHLQQLALQKGQRVQCLCVAFAKTPEQPLVPGDPARLQQRGLHRDVGGRFSHAFGGGAHAGCDLQPAVPATADEGLELGLQARGVVWRLAIGQEHQHVHIGVGKQLRTTKAAHSGQTQLITQAGLLPQPNQNAIDQAGELPQGPLQGPGRNRPARERFEQCRLVAAEGVAQCGGFGHGVLRNGGQQLALLTKEGSGGLPAERVRTS